MSKDLDARLDRIEKRLIQSQAVAVLATSQATALRQLLEELAKRSRQTVFWDRQFPAAFYALTSEAERKILSQIEKEDRELASAIRRELAAMKGV